MPYSGFLPISVGFEHKKKPKKPNVKLEIEIRSNEKDSGKTTIAAIISKALKDAGFSNINVVSAIGDYHTVQTAVIKNNKVRASEDILDTPITVIDFDNNITK